MPEHGPAPEAVASEASEPEAPALHVRDLVRIAARAVGEAVCLRLAGGDPDRSEPASGSEGGLESEPGPDPVS